MTKKSMKKISFLGSIGAVASPVFFAISCGDDSYEEINLIASGTQLFDGTNIDRINESKNESQKKSSNINYIDKIAYQSAFQLYEEEQKASIRYQYEQFTWDLYVKLESYTQKLKDFLEQNWTSTSDKSTNNKSYFSKDIVSILGTTPNETIEVNGPKIKTLTIQNINDVKNNLNNGDIKLAQGSTDANKTSFENEKKSLNDVLDSILEVKKRFDNITIDANDSLKSTFKGDYKSSDFLTSYVEILKPIDLIKEEQTKSYNETKEAYISTFATRSQGNVAWVEERKSRYNQALNDDEAISYLVNGIVNNSAFAKYKIDVNSSYTKKQALSGVFSFLSDVDANGAITVKTQITNEFKNTIDSTKDKKSSDRIYFLGSKTKNVSKILFDFSDTSIQKALDNYSNNGVLMKVRHMLMPITQNTSGYTLPWQKSSSAGDNAISMKQMVQNLMSFTPLINGADHAYDLMEFALDDTNEEKSKLFVSNFSGNEASTKYKNGSLGLYEWNNLLSSMDSPFSLAIAAGYDTNYANTDLDWGVNSTLPDGNAVLGEIKNGLKKIVDDATNNISDQTSLINWLNAKTDDEIIKIFGPIFRDAFKDRSLVYKLTNDRIMTFTSFGIHIIKVDYLANQAALINNIGKDFEQIVKNKDANKAEIQYGTLFNEVFSNKGIVSSQIENPDFKTILKKLQENLTLMKDWKDANYFTDEEYSEWEKDKTNNELLYTSLKRHIDNINKTERVQNTLNSLGNKVSDFYIAGLDTESRKIQSTLDPQTIYKQVLVLGGVYK